MHILFAATPTQSDNALTEIAAGFDETAVDRFGFGRNWLDYQTSVDAARLAAARADIESWLGTSTLAGKRVLDIGSGSGVHSLCLHAMGAAELVSFDFDADSVQATTLLHAEAGAPASWTVRQGSVLDAAFITSLGTFDLVYSWGVLHHTGQLWRALEQASRCVKHGGTLFISIYAKGPNYAADLALKQRYHAASRSDKRRIEFEWIAERYQLRSASGLTPEGWWTEGRERGMDPYWDLLDWLGGLPYEVATVAELTTQLRAAGIAPRRVRECPGDGGCHILVGQRVSEGALPVALPGESSVQTVRVEWPAQAPVVWVGALHPTHAPERVVELAYLLPSVAFVMVAAGFDAADASVRASLSHLATNLRIMDAPTDGQALRALLDGAGAVLHTAAAGPATEWVATVASLGVPMLCLHDDAQGTIAATGCGVVTDGDLTRLAERTSAWRNATLSHEAIPYARASLAGVVWTSARFEPT